MLYIMVEKKEVKKSSEIKRGVLSTWLVASYGIAANAPIAVATLYFVGLAG